jgi:hypothetical protein
MFFECVSCNKLVYTVTPKYIDLYDVTLSNITSSILSLEPWKWTCLGLNSLSQEVTTKSAFLNI